MLACGFEEFTILVDTDPSGEQPTGVNIKVCGVCMDFILCVLRWGRRCGVCAGEKEGAGWGKGCVMAVVVVVVVVVVCFRCVSGVLTQ
jgi:hypothetical protein